MRDEKEQLTKNSLTTFGFLGLVISGLIIGILVLALYGALIYFVTEMISAEVYMIILVPLLSSLILLYVYLRCGERIKKINDAFLFFVAAVKAMQLAGESIGYTVGIENYFPVPNSLGLLIIISSSAVLKAMISFLEIFKKEDCIVSWLNRKIKLSDSKAD
ncbi:MULTISPECIES: hypothetical protein [Klebsiella/Raoultella group]|uniref:hypothetical protein n=1 Tax=Klebsiella/Raoultella group TaxID=2890311 RepID=UPI0006505790|nr:MULTISPECIES: hypothetical protein [Klebsiella/Raoultella group]HDR2750220.1 hypothetical protein [Enterobacter asburiae]EJG2383967.1 hypothetical protein [Raoultella ornithinolytica]KMK45966.1 hypothetical protein ABW14_06795 [Klebsiella michiganensis]RWS93998.1 hypothetical protein DN592_29960 [Raoultella ornithinolytica]HDR2775514.1 hypothetical protein [Enterobacter asburiae]